MAINFISTSSKSLSTYRDIGQMDGTIADGIEPYKETEAITNEVLARPFMQVQDKLKQIYKALADRGINAS